ncbi:MAG: 1-deoxy-D-xylulose-5-phosphate reductoisomerase, partial [Syntrophaceae bacterium]|nr:1-deoxy-D-xylulose-5-phosphate reductoisomerase [Syntrophaceae bacterium]
MKNISILGSTGSIGVSTLEIISAHPDRFRIIAMTAGKNLELFVQQIKRFLPRIAVVASAEDVPRLKGLCSGLDVTILGGVEGLIA